MNKIKGFINMSKPCRNEKCNEDNSIIFSPSDTVEEAKEFDKWDKTNKDREIPKPTLAESPHLNKICPPKWEMEALLKPEIKNTPKGKVKEFINKYFNQNNYGTRFPIYFCIRDYEYYPCPEGTGDRQEFLDRDSNEIISHLEYTVLSEKEQDNYEEVESKKYPVDKGVFLLEEEAKQHLKVNHYHYSNEAHIYCHHMWRSPETEEFLNNLKELLK